MKNNKQWSGGTREHWEGEEMKRKFDLLRASRILELRKRGETYRQIGSQLGLSSERVRQIEFKANRIFNERDKMKEGIKTLLYKIDYVVSRCNEGNKEETFDKIDKALYDTTIWDLEITVRVANALKHSNIRTVGELVQKTRKELLEIRNLGKKSLKELEEELSKFGLRIGMKLKWGPP